VGCGTHSTRAVLHLCLVCSSISDELRQIVCGQIFACDEHNGLLDDQCDWRKIGFEVVERILVERLVQCHEGAAEYELGAVGRGFRHATGARHATRTADVLEDDWLAQKLGEARREQTSQNIC
jgi:hypothetical protein